MKIKILTESYKSAIEKYGPALVANNRMFDHTTTYKFLEFLCKTDKETGSMVYGQIRQTLKDFEKISKNLKKKDINQYKTWKEMQNIVDNYTYKDYVKKIFKSVPDGAEKIFENDKAMVVRVDTYEASCYYGSGKFCIAATGGSGHWERYQYEGNKFFYIIDKNDIKHPQVMQVDDVGNFTLWNKDNNSEKYYEPTTNSLEIPAETFE